MNALVEIADSFDELQDGCVKGRREGEIVLNFINKCFMLIHSCCANKYDK